MVKLSYQCLVNTICLSAEHTQIIKINPNIGLAPLTTQEFVVNCAIKLRLFYPRPNVYILLEMDIWFLLSTTYFRNPGFGTVFTRRDVGVKKVVSSHPYSFAHRNKYSPMQNGLNIKIKACSNSFLLTYSVESSELCVSTKIRNLPIIQSGGEITCGVHSTCVLRIVHSLIVHVY